MKSRFLITGGAGFIGSNTAQFLLGQGHHVRVLDDFSYGHRDNLPEETEDFELVDGSICDEDLVKKALEGVDYVLHMAALSAIQLSIQDPLQSHETNVTGTLKVLKASVDAGVKRFVMSSSCSVYGNLPGLPKTESDGTMPESPYALTKLLNEEYCKLFFRLYGLPTCILRYFNVYGPRQRAGSQYAAVIPVFKKALKSGSPLTINGDGSQTRDFVYVEDVVKANLACCHADTRAFGQVFNIGNGERISILELARILSRFSDAEPEMIFRPAQEGEVLHSEADVSKALDLLGWAPETLIEQGLKSTYEW